jgi:hypothetical protein
MGTRDKFETREWSGIPEEKRRQGFEWGLASAIMGGVFMLMASIQLIANMLLFQWIGRSLGTSDVRIALAVAVVGVPGIVCACLVSLLFGVRGLRRARRYDQPAGIAIAGILLSSAALFLWILLGVDIFAILLWLDSAQPDFVP